jgi:cellobiose phosphorylase
VEYETDRVRFLGRGRTPANPAALDPGARLSGTTGPVLDPVFSLRWRVRLDPGGRARIAFVTGVADTREAAIALAEHFREFADVERTFAGAHDGCRHELSELGLTPDDVALYNRLAGAVLFTSPALRQPDAVAANRLGQPGLWPYGISGDRPIVLVRVTAADDGSMVRHVVQWHAYARRRGLDPDLVILDERPDGDADRLQADLQAGPAGPLLGKPGGVFVLDAGKVSADDVVLLTAAARAVLGGGPRSLADQLDCRPAAAALPPPLTITQPPAPEPAGTPAMPPRAYGSGTAVVGSQAMVAST